MGTVQRSWERFSSGPLLLAQWRLRSLPGQPLTSPLEEQTSEGGELVVEAGLSDPTEEAETVAQEIKELSGEPEVPVITSYDLRLLDNEYSSELDALELASASYHLPESCEMADTLTLQCESELILVRGSVLDANGDEVPNQTVLSDGLISVSAQVDIETQYPLSFSAYVFDEASAPLVDVAVETLGEMVGGDMPTYTEEELQEEERLLNDAVTPPSDENAFNASHLKRRTNGNAALILDRPQAGAAVYAFAFEQNDGISIVPASGSRPPKVTVPRNYKYCPWTCRPKNLHDYCSWSPDRYAGADFRGPCARHDMSIETISKKRVSNHTKRHERSRADIAFKNNLRQNCRHTYWQSTEIHKDRRKNCFQRTSLYYSKVSDRTRDWLK